jgi:release factor glutamine methyltransferase
MPDNIKGLLQTAETQLTAISATPALDAEVLLCLCLDKDRAFLRAWPESPVEASLVNQYQQLLSERLAGLPVAYLTGSREFWSRNFLVNANVLIPRPETELLIELSLALLPEKQPLKVLDLGTGSGIIAITIAKERPFAAVTAVDVCAKALGVAKQNAALLDAANIKFQESNWFAAVNDSGFDLIVANPPYIAAEEYSGLERSVHFEPKTALISRDQGLKDLSLICTAAHLYLKHEGNLLLEHGYEQKTSVQTILKTLNYQSIYTHADLSGHDRATSAIWRSK